MDKEILTTFEAAKYCHVHPGTIKNWIRNESLKAFKTPGGHRRIYRRDLDLFLKENEIPISEMSKSLRKRVLVIVDDYLERESVAKALLRRTEMFETASAGNAFEGGEFLVAFKPDLVLLDSDLPGIDPEEIARRIKSSPYLEDVRVVMLSNTPVHRKPNEKGVDLYSVKPVDPDKLCQDIISLLGARKAK